MPFTSPTEEYPVLMWARRVRQTPVAAYGVAVLSVAVATLVRRMLGGAVIEGVPFITYFPAIIIAALLGGLWPGLLAVAFSSVLAWVLFLPPALDSPHAMSLLLFGAIGCINVIVVALLNAAVDRVMAQEQNVRVLIESAPNGVVVVDEKGRITRVNAATEKLFGYERSELLGKKH